MSKESFTDLLKKKQTEAKPTEQPQEAHQHVISSFMALNRGILMCGCGRAIYSAEADKWLEMDNSAEENLK